MFRTIASSVLSLALLAGPVLAQTCEPAKLAEAVDRYWAEPFSARNWRVLQGLGDPMIEPSQAGSDTWASQERWRKLTAEIMPESQDLQSVSWNCRIGYPLSVLEKRIGALGLGFDCGDEVSHRLIGDRGLGLAHERLLT